MADLLSGPARDKLYDWADGPLANAKSIDAVVDAFDATKEGHALALAAREANELYFLALRVFGHEARKKRTCPTCGVIAPQKEPT